MKQDKFPKRGEVWWVAFDPAVGGKVKKTRPAIIVSNDSSNQFLNRVQVVPISSKVAKLYPSEAYVTFRRKKHKAMADQLTTASKYRLRQRLGMIKSAEMEEVERTVQVQLGLK